jgi:CheY-like chemotaxis protein
MNNQRKPAEILVVDDNPGDVELIHEAMQSGRVLSRISVTADGESALAFLNRAQGYEGAPCPDLILLDLNIPRKDGFEVLKAVRDNPALSRIPVVILSSSQACDDISKCYNLHANCFISKPAEVDEFLTAVRSVGDFWLSTAKLPRDSTSARR